MPDLMQDIVSAAQMGHATWKAGYDECKAELRRKLKRISDMDISEGAKALEFLTVLTKFLGFIYISPLTGARE